MIHGEIFNTKDGNDSDNLKELDLLRGEKGNSHDKVGKINTFYLPKVINLR